MVNIISLLREDLAGCRRSEIERIADAMEVPRGTLRRIVSGATNDPRYSTVRRIAAYYAKSSPDKAI